MKIFRLGSKSNDVEEDFIEEDFIEEDFIEEECIEVECVEEPTFRSLKNDFSDINICM